MLDQLTFTHKTDLTNLGFLLDRLVLLLYCSLMFYLRIMRDALYVTDDEQEVSQDLDKELDYERGNLEIPKERPLWAR
jgi:hypothetical protein